ncbi:MAG: hypothetical protein ACRC2T_00150 [Thermoguttaceae bacterium]
MKNSGKEPTDSRLDGRSREAEHFTRSYLCLNGRFPPMPGSGIEADLETVIRKFVAAFYF